MVREFDSIQKKERLKKCFFWGWVWLDPKKGHVTIWFVIWLFLWWVWLNPKKEPCYKHDSIPFEEYTASNSHACFFECSHGGEPWYHKGSFRVDFFLKRVISRALFAWLFFWTSNGSSSWVFLNFFQVSQGGEPFSELVQVCHDGEAYDKNTLFLLALAEWEIWRIRYQHFEHLFHEYWHVKQPYYIKDHL